MAGDGGVMRRFNGRDGGLARLDAVKKIAPMLSGLVELDLAHRFGKGIGLDPVLIGCIEAAAIDPYPAVCVDPLGPHGDGRMAAGDGHGDVA